MQLGNTNNDSTDRKNERFFEASAVTEENAVLSSRLKFMVRPALGVGAVIVETILEDIEKDRRNLNKTKNKMQGMRTHIPLLTVPYKTSTTTDGSP